VHTPSTRLNDPLWCSHGAAAGGVGRLVGGLGGVSGLESGLLIWVLCLLSAEFWAVKAGRF